MTEFHEPTVAESTILTRIAAGNADALTAWFLQHKDAVYAFVFYRVGGDPELAADATQATFTAALEQLAEFEPERGDMITWLRLLSRNIIRDTLVRRRRGVELQAVWDRLDESLRAAYERIDSELLPPEVLERQETRELVGMALANLPPQYRDVLEAKYIDDQSLQAIAAGRDSTIDSVKSLLRRARAAFRECFVTLAKLEMSDA